MFEQYTFEYLMETALATVSDTVDKRQGSIIYDAIAPSCTLLAQFYVELSNYSDEYALKTANDAFLDNQGYIIGLDRDPAVACIREATFVGATPVEGNRFTSGDLTWIVNSDIDVVCETTGIIGNAVLVGEQMISIDNIPGLTSATMGVIVIPGTDEQGNENYRSEIVTAIDTPALNSNKAQVKAWAESVTGVIKANVTPLWDGVNTVKVSLIGTDYQTATPTVVSNVKEYIDPTATEGLGEGQADIGLILTAIQSTEVAINTTFNCTLANGYSLSQAEAEYQVGLELILKGIVDAEGNQLKYNEIGNMVFNMESITDYNTLLVNGAANNIAIGGDEVAVFGTVVASEI